MAQIQNFWHERQGIAVTGNSIFLFFNNEPFLPRLVRPVRHVRPVRQSPQHCPNGTDTILKNVMGQYGREKREQERAERDAMP